MTTMTYARDAQFWDRISEKYAQKPVPDLAVYKEKLRLTQGYFPPDAQVLEVGCGTGSTAVAHAPFVGHMHATDLSPEMIRIARGRADKARVQNVTFEATSVEALSGAPERYDAILALSLLHLVEDRVAVLKKLGGMLKPRGVLVTSTACLTGVLRVFPLIAPLGRALGYLPTLRSVSPDQLTREIEGLGLATEYRRHPQNRHSLFLVSRKLG
ncbi:MAG: class I SAM-dependent methyltransferase [Pseudomonadota bacterium]